MTKETFNFRPEKEYTNIKQLGSGSCGVTKLLKDETIDKYFVCKKFKPDDDIEKNQHPELFERFINEIRILFERSHPNIVRVYNSFLYEKELTGYINMEYIEGDSIDVFLQNNPHEFENIFTQTISGFKYLEEKNILHRDIRATNIMVQKNSEVKIIDFGFGKLQLKKEIEDFSKSMSVNWIDSIPFELEENKYNFKTEIYFVGCLFKQILERNNISNIKLQSIIDKMIRKLSQQRYSSFSEVYLDLAKGALDRFSDEEKNIYQAFSNKLAYSIQTVSSDRTFDVSIKDTQSKLLDLYTNSMLEEYVADVKSLVNCFMLGDFIPYEHAEPISLQTFKDFVNLLESSSEEKVVIIINNIKSRLSAIELKIEPLDDIPF